MIDLSKHDMTMTYSERTFSIRAYRDDSPADGPGWKAIIVEARTPVFYEPRTFASVEECFAEAVRYLVMSVDIRRGAAAARA